jgi:DNA-binding response OmpR family regulator
VSLPHILVVDDERNLADTIAYNLRKEGFEVDTAGEGYAAVEAVRNQRPDAIILDLMLPGIDGLEVCRRIRRTSAVPILMLTARGEEMDRVVGLEIGADDYLSKPFSMRELLARVRALLRRREMLRDELGAITVTMGEVLVAGDLRIDVGAHTVTLGDEPVELTPKQFALLETLVRHRGQVLSAEQLLELVWGYTDSDTRTVAVHMRSLRTRIEEDPSHPIRIETVRGVGYRYTR